MPQLWPIFEFSDVPKYTIQMDISELQHSKWHFKTESFKSHATEIYLEAGTVAFNAYPHAIKN